MGGQVSSPDLTDYSNRVVCVVKIDNQTDVDLKAGQFYLDYGKKGYGPVDIRARSKGTVMVGHQTLRNASGTTGVLGCQIGDTQDMLVIMWSAPFNFDHYDNCYGLGFQNVKYIVDENTYKDMYKKPFDENSWFSRKKVCQGKFDSEPIDKQKGRWSVKAWMEEKHRCHLYITFTDIKEVLKKKEMISEKNETQDDEAGSDDDSDVKKSKCSGKQKVSVKKNVKNHQNINFSGFTAGIVAVIGLLIVAIWRWWDTGDQIQGFAAITVIGIIIFGAIWSQRGSEYNYQVLGSLVSTGVIILLMATFFNLFDTGNQNRRSTDSSEPHMNFNKQVKKYILDNIAYSLDEQKSNKKPNELARTMVENNGNSDQEVKRTLSYSYEQSDSWSIAGNLNFGVKTDIIAGIPMLNNKIEASTTFSYSHQWGSSSSKKNSDSFSISPKVPPKHRKQVILTSYREETDVPYEATLTIIYSDGDTNKIHGFRGIYRNIQVTDISVYYGEDIPL